MKIILDGQELDKNDYTGAKGAQIEVRDSDEEGNRVTSVSQTFTLTGAAYDIVAASFISATDGRQNSIEVLIYDDSCCDEDTLLFTGRLTSDNVSWCHGICSVDCLFTEYTEHTKQMDCVMSTLIYDDRNGFQSNPHPKMVYCVEMRPDFLQHLVLIFGVILNIILLVLTPVVAALTLLNEILEAIQNTINLIPGVNITITFDFDGDSSTNLLEEYQNFKDQLNSRIIGCGRKHPAPLVRKYIENVCEICGITFQSSIYNNPSSEYYMATMLNAPVAKGSISGANWIDLNNPIMTLSGFLDMLKLVHNARWDIKDGVLRFERHDFFNSGAPWASFATLKESGLVQGELCLQWRDDTRPSYISMKYAPDAVDVAGNEAAERYNEIVEWNNPYSSLQSGSREIQLGFGTPRFRDDDVEQDILGFYSGAPFIGSTINSYKRVLILEKHLCFNPKLLIWDGNMDFGRTKKFITPGVDWDGTTNLEENNNYNFPYSFNDANCEPNTAYPSNQPNMGLYGRFYSIDNPKLTIDYGKSWTFTMYYNCEALQTLQTIQFIELPLGTSDVPSIGRVDSISVNLDDKTITFQGTV